MLWNTIRMSFSNLRANAVRTFLTMLGVIIGISSIIALLTIGQGVTDSVIDQLSGLGGNRASVSITDRTVKKGFTDGELERFSDLPGVDGVSPTLSGTRVLTLTPELTSSKYDGVHTTARRVMGVNDYYFSTYTKNAGMHLGRSITVDDVRYRTNVCVLGYDLWQRLYGNYSPIGEIIKVNNTDCTVIGVMNKLVGLDVSGNSALIVPYTTAVETFSMGLPTGFDVVISSSTYPLDSYAAYRIAKKAKAKYIHEAHDIWPLTLTEIGGMSKLNPFVVLLAIAEKRTYKKAESVVSVLPDSYKHMLQHGLQTKDKFFHIPNGVVLQDWQNAEPLPAEHAAAFARLREEGKFVVCYLGGHALSNSLDVYLDAAARMKNENVAFVLIGNGVEKARLMLRAEEEKSNVVFLPPVTKKAVPTVLAAADALYIGAKACALYRYGVSLNKVYDYMMAARPIVYGVEASNNEVAEAECGMTITPDSAEAIAKAVAALQQMGAEGRTAMGERGKRWVLENCEYKKLAERFLAVIEREGAAKK